MILYQLQLEGCGEEWRDVSVQCVGRRGDMKVYSQTARLSVNSEGGAGRVGVCGLQPVRCVCLCVCRL